MADDAEERPDQLAWDRVGRFFEDMGRLTAGIWDRNLELWNGVSTNVRTKKQYGANEVAGDASRAMSAAMDNLDDIWTSVTRVPEREQVATPLPTAFMYFAEGEDGVYDVPEPVWIRVAPTAALRELPRNATIKVDGPDGGVEPLEACLRATRVERMGYKLQAYGVGDLVGGVYTGVVYVAPRPRLLASLRVVVEEQGGQGGGAAN